MAHRMHQHEREQELRGGRVQRVPHEIPRREQPERRQHRGADERARHRAHGEGQKQRRVERRAGQGEKRAAGGRPAKARERVEARGQVREQRGERGRANPFVRGDARELGQNRHREKRRGHGVKRGLPFLRHSLPHSLQQQHEPAEKDHRAQNPQVQARVRRAPVAAAHERLPRVALDRRASRLGARHLVHAVGGGNARVVVALTARAPRRRARRICGNRPRRADVFRRNVRRGEDARRRQREREGDAQQLFHHGGPFIEKGAGRGGFGEESRPA